MNLKHLTDQALLSDAKQLSQQYRSVTVKLLHHLREIELRKLYCDLGYHSFFDYVVKELGFSEPSAARRIRAARLLNDVPQVERKIEDGKLTLSNISMAAQVFKNENITQLEKKEEILALLENKTTRECEKTLKEVVAPRVSPEILIKIYLNEADYKIFNELKDLLSNKESFWRQVLSAAFDQLTKQKFKTTSKMTPSTASSSRYIPAGLKKAVFERDKCCQSCGSKHLLEFDHIKPFALGGKTEMKNLRLLCRSCNQRARIRQRLASHHGMY